jgi:nitrogen-specific signal transduction histidine kinase
VSKTVPSADEARHRLYEIMKQEGEFESKARDALELGTAYLGVDSGFVTRVDPDTDHWETIVSTDGTDGLVPTGATKNLSGTYCRHTLERDSPLAVHDIPASDKIDDDGGFQCYHGTTLTVEGDPYGTVCFVAQDAREQPFDEAETMFAELVGRLLEHELEHHRQQEELARQTTMINVLDRVLRHNIRNDVTVMRAMGQLLAEEREDCRKCATIVEKADNLVSMSETARHLGKLINEESQRRPVDLAAVTRSTVADARENHPEASITTDLPAELVVPVLGSLETALWEVVENAVTHTGARPEVHVSLAETEDCVELVVEDDGPGIPDSERHVLETGTETQLSHGSGLGLWSVYWIVTSHGGGIDIDVTSGTRIRLRLPREATTTNEPEGRRAADRYRAAFESVPVGLLILDDDGWIVGANDRVCELLDRRSDQLTGRKLGDVSSAADFEIGEHAAEPPDAVETDRQTPTDVTETLTVETGDGHGGTLGCRTVRDIVPGQHLLLVEEEPR